MRLSSLGLGNELTPAVGRTDLLLTNNRLPSTGGLYTAGSRGLLVCRVTDLSTCKPLVLGGTMTRRGGPPSKPIQRLLMWHNSLALTACSMWVWQSTWREIRSKANLPVPGAASVSRLHESCNKWVNRCCSTPFDFLVKSSVPFTIVTCSSFQGPTSGP